MNDSSLTEANEMLQRRFEAIEQARRKQKEDFEYDQRTIAAAFIAWAEESCRVLDAQQVPRRLPRFYILYNFTAHDATDSFNFSLASSQFPELRGTYFRRVLTTRQKLMPMHSIANHLQDRFPLYHVVHDSIRSFIEFEYMHPAWKVLALAVPTAATKPKTPAAKLARLDGDHRVMVKVRDMLVEMDRRV
jgi:hypothetical protein